MKKILIVGAYGILAKYLINEFLLLNDIELYGLVREIDNSRKIENVEYRLSEDFLNGNFDINGFDYVINCAFTQTMSAENVCVSIDFTKALFEKIAQYDVACVINISTQRVYGDYREYNAKETDKINPSNVYALGKYFAEILAEVIFSKTNISYTNFRIGSLIGKEYTERVLNKMVNIAKNKGHISVQNGNQKFGYIHVSDVALAIKKFIQNTPPHTNLCKIYNIGSNEYSLTLLDIAKKIQSKLNKEGYFISIECKDSDRKSLMNSSLFENEFNWNQERSIDDFIDELC